MAESAEQETPLVLGVVDVETVFDFLRKNGLAEAELALREDIIEGNRELGSFDFEKFLFDLPPVRIPASVRRTELKGGDDRVLGSKSSSGSSSVEEFVSLGSSTSGMCSSSGFSNPYGRRSASVSNSETSSGSLSQFATARDYPDFDTQNDFYWYDEKEESHFMTPCFQRQDFFGCPSEDKFVMSSETELQFENPLGLHGKSEGSVTDASSEYLDKQCVFNVLSTDKNEAQAIDHFSDKRNWSEERIKEDTTSLSLCKCCPYVGGIHGSVSVDYSCLSSKEPYISAFQLNVGDMISDGHTDHLQREKEDTNYSPNRNSKRQFKKSGGIIPIAIDDYGVEHGAQMDGETDELVPAADGEAIIGDELSMYDAQENEYDVFDLRIIHRENRTGFEENKDLPIFLNTVIVSRYYVTEYLGSAAFSKVIQAQDLYTGINVCLKIIKNDKDFFDQSLDEIKLLKLVNKHDPADERHILRLYDYFYHQEHLFIVCELLRANLYEFQKFNQESGGEPYFTLSRLQIITRQCLEALDYLHHLGIIHCDLKPENILIKSYRKCEIKVIDLGSSCFQSDNLCLYVQSCSYRAPEVMIGLSYDQKIDLWSLGCILAELWSGEVCAFSNDTVVMILARMIGLLGPIDTEMLLRGQETHKYFTEDHDLYYMNEETHNQVEYIIPAESSLEHHLQISDFGFTEFLRNLLEVNPLRRPTAREALEHPWLSHLYPN